MIPAILSLLLITSAVATLGLVGVWAKCVRPTAAEGTTWVAAVVVVVVMLVKSSGPLEWFMAPSVFLHPALNWTFLLIWILLVPIRSAFYLFRAEAAVEDFMHSSLDLGQEFEAWLEAGGGMKLREVQARMGIHSPVQFRASSVLGSPITRGALSPVVMLPLAWLPAEALPPQGRDALNDLGLTHPKTSEAVFSAVLHELGHHPGRDPQRALLRAFSAAFLPLEWTLSNADSARFEAPGVGQLERWVHKFLKATRFPVQAIVQKAWSFQERRADESAAALAPHALSQLQILRGGSGEVRRISQGRVPPLLNWGWVAACMVVVVLGLRVLPGRALMNLSLGGSGAVRGIRPKGWSLDTMENPYRQTPTLYYLPATRLRPARLEYFAAKDAGAMDYQHSRPQGLMCFVEAYPPERIQGEATYLVSWDFWRFADPAELPMFPVVVMLRPVESSRVSLDPRTQTFFSSDQPEFTREDLGGGHFRATWKVTVPVGRTADYFSIEWRSFTTGRVIFEPPKVTKLSEAQKKDPSTS